MSIDERLRSALRPDDDATSHDELVGALHAVEVGARRHRLLRAGAVAGLAAACALAVGLAVVPGEDGAAPPVSPPTPSATPTPQGGGPETTGPLDGQWQSALLTRADVADHLRAEGLGRWSDRYVRTLPEGRFRVWVNVYGGQVGATVGGDVVDGEGFLVSPEDRRVVLQPFQAGYGSTTLAYAREGGELRFTLVRSDHRGWEGFPAEVHQTAVFTTAPFRRR